VAALRHFDSVLNFPLAIVALKSGFNVPFKVFKDVMDNMMELNFSPIDHTK